MSPTHALRGLVLALGGVATAAGLHTVKAGAASVPGARRANVAVESEIRFYGAFYAAYGVTALAIASRAERETNAVRGLAAALFGAGLARAHAWRVDGAPHPAQRGLLALELAIPPGLLALQAAAAQPTGPSTRSV